MFVYTETEYNNITTLCRRGISVFLGSILIFLLLLLLFILMGSIDLSKFFCNLAILGIYLDFIVFFISVLVMPCDIRAYMMLAEWEWRKWFFSLTIKCCFFSGIGGFV